MSQPLLKYREPVMAQDILTETIPARLYAEGSALNLARAALFGVPLSKVESIVELLRTYRGGRPNSLIGGGPLGWSWYSTLAAMATDHHGNMAGFGGTHHAHSQLSGVGIDDHHARDHAARHQLGGADQVSLDLSQIGTGWDKQSFINLLENGDFEVGSPPTGWSIGDGSVARSTEQVKIGTYSAKVTATAIQTPYYYQRLSGMSYYVGRKITLGGWIWADVANRQIGIQLRFHTAGDVFISQVFSSYHPGDSTYRWMTVTATVPANTGIIYARAVKNVEGEISSFYVDGMILVEGDVCPAFSPKPARYKEQDASEIITGRFGMPRMPDGTSGQVLTAQGAGVDPIYAAAPGIWEKIAIITLAADAASVEFSGLSTNYNSFRLHAWVKLASVVNRFLVRFNDDAGANYGWERVYIDGGSTIAAGYEYGQTSAEIGFFGPYHYGPLVAFLQNRAAASEKLFLGHSVYGPNKFRLHGGTWLNTSSKITKITLLPETGNIIAGSEFILEGCKE